jgi:hypothetical protein
VKSFPQCTRLFAHARKPRLNPRIPYGCHAMNCIPQVPSSASETCRRNTREFYFILQYLPVLLLLDRHPPSCHNTPKQPVHVVLRFERIKNLSSPSRWSSRQQPATDIITMTTIELLVEIAKAPEGSTLALSADMIGRNELALLIANAALKDTSIRLSPAKVARAMQMSVQGAEVTPTARLLSLDTPQSWY